MLALENRAGDCQNRFREKNRKEENRTEKEEKGNRTRMKKSIGPFIAAVITAYVLAALMYSQINLSNLVEMGVDVTASTRFTTAIHDVIGMTALYLPIITVALLIGFVVARLIINWVPQLRTIGYILAGFVGIYAVDTALELAFLTHPITVTRTTIGLLSQCVAGAVGGYVFALMTAPKDDVSDLTS